jgi:serine protease Do
MPLPAPGRAIEALRRSTAFISNRRRNHAGTGSAIVLTNETLVTNAHVVGAAGTVQVESWEGKTTGATVLKIDHSRDLALLHAPGLGAPPAALADSDAVRPGTPVIAVGNPVGFKGAVSTGTVHSSGPISINGTDPALSRRWVCADIHLAPGNSGGPLADWEGRVIGVNTMVMSSGLALAVPSRAVDAFLAADKRRSLGVTLRPVRLSQQGIGLLILEMEPRGAVALASLIPGDILIGANEEPFRNIEDLETALARVRDQTLTLQFRRGGDQKGRRVTVQWAPPPITTAA